MGWPGQRSNQGRLPQRATVTGSTLCEINTTPLIDVMLVLLVALIVSLPIVTHAVKIDLPRPPQRAQDQLPEPIDLDIDFDGTLVWNGNALSGLEELTSYFRTEARKVPQPEVHLRPDPHARYDIVAQVLASAQHSGMQRIGFVNTAKFRDASF